MDSCKDKLRTSDVDQSLKDRVLQSTALRGPANVPPAEMSSKERSYHPGFAASQGRFAGIGCPGS
jgi:hypothetical protein